MRGLPRFDPREALQGAGGRLACRNCREKRRCAALPSVAPTPAALAALNPLERRLLAMAKVDQVLIDKLPSGGPSAQWGRMYVVPTEEPEICDLLEEAELGEDGVVYVRGVQGLAASTARLGRLYEGLQALKEHHAFYKESEKVNKALSDMERILARRPAAAPLAGRGEEGEEELEVTYLTAREPVAPRANA